MPVNGSPASPILRHSATVLLAATLVVCSGQSGEGGAAAPPPDPGLVVATVGGKPVEYKAFQRYLADNAGEETGEGDIENTIKSRLLDQFIEELLLLGAADKMKIAVSDAEIDSYMAQIGVTEGEAEAAGVDSKDAFRDKVRQGMVLQKVKDAAVLSKIEVTPGEVEDELKKQPELMRPDRVVVLRQILVDDRSLAERLARQLAAGPQGFEAVAREHSVASDRGQARSYGEEELPVELRGPLFDLAPGQVSGVLEHAQRFLIFQLVRKIEDQPRDQEEVRQRIRMGLFQKKGEQALDRYIADLKKETEIRVNRSILPFDYTGEYRG